MFSVAILFFDRPKVRFERVLGPEWNQGDACGRARVFPRGRIQTDQSVSLLFSSVVCGCFSLLFLIFFAGFP